MPQTIMSANPSLRHIQRRLVTFFHFIQCGVLGPTVLRKLFTALIEKLALSLRFLRSRWRILRERKVNSSSLNLTKPKVDEGRGSTISTDGQSQEQASVLQSTINEQTVLPIAYSLYPSRNEPHHGSSSRSSQMLDVAALSRSPEILCRDRKAIPHISGPDGSYLTTDPTSSAQPHLGSFPTVDTRLGRRANLHRLKRGSPQPSRSDSAESIEQLGYGEMSSSRDFTLVAELSDVSVDSPEKLSHQETLVSSPTCEDPRTPALSSCGISPLAPENFKRYEKRLKIPQVATTVKLRPILRDFSDHDDIPGWTTCIHPEGGRYFHHAEKRIFTDVDLHDELFRIRITQVITDIEVFIEKHHEHIHWIPEKTDLVLDLNWVEDCYVTHYYFADHESRIVFFLDEFLSDNLPHWSEIKGVSSGTHLQQALETQYWWHCHTYPNCIELSDDLVCELRASLMHFISDCMTSPYANSPYTSENLEKLLGYTDSLKENIGKPYSGCISFLGRLMYSISNMRFLNFHGQPEARLNRDQSVYGDRTNRRTWFISSISIFLFSAPDVHLKTLQKMWVDGILHKTVWEQSLKKVTDEWREFILYATVLLNANVAFLAIQSVDSNRDPRSPAQISSYCSVSCSIGSIILGLLLVRQNQTKHRETVRDMQKFLTNRVHPWLGLETLAIMFSLPYALLMWGMVSFLMAFWFMCLQGSGAVTRSVIATVSSIILILITWCIWTSWEKEPPSDAEDPEENLSFEVDADKKKWKGFTFMKDTTTATTPQPTEYPPWFTNFSLPTVTTWALKIRNDSSNTMVPDEESVDERGRSSVDEKGKTSVDETEKSCS